MPTSILKITFGGEIFQCAVVIKVFFFNLITIKSQLELFICCVDVNLFLCVINVFIF